MNENLYSIIKRRLPGDNARAFIESPDGRRISYGELDAASGRIASLLSDCGVVPGDRVAAIVEKSPEATFLYLACLRVGAVYLPLNTAYQEAELAYFLGDAEPRVVVCDPGAEDKVAPLAARHGGRTLTLDAEGGGSLTEESRAHDGDFPAAERARSDLAALLYTSGTTGRSKGAMLSHGNLSSNALALHDLWGFRPDDTLLHALPIFHTHGLFVAINCVLLAGARMLFLPRFDPETVIRLLPQATVMMGVPTFYTRLLARDDFTAETCRRIRLFVSGSAPLLEETFEAFRARCGHSILERYGMTETGMNSSNPLDGERRAGTVGFALPEVEFRVAGEDGRILPPGEVGVLEVRGPNVFHGYWRQPEKTEEEFRPDGFFITGDVSRIDERGYLQIVGRAKDLIISGGFNVYPKEVELIVDQVPGVGESAVIGLPHPDFGEAVVAVATRSGDAVQVSEAAVISAAKGELANYKVPKKVFFLDALPRNAMGKVQKNLLRERYRDTFTGTV